MRAIKEKKIEFRFKACNTCNKIVEQILYIPTDCIIGDIILLQVSIYLISGSCSKYTVVQNSAVYNLNITF